VTAAASATRQDSGPTPTHPHIVSSNWNSHNFFASHHHQQQHDMPAPYYFFGSQQQQQQQQYMPTQQHMFTPEQVCTCKWVLLI
jgi:hypothetical protein